MLHLLEGSVLREQLKDRERKRREERHRTRRDSNPRPLNTVLLSLIWLVVANNNKRNATFFFATLNVGFQYWQLILSTFSTQQNFSPLFFFLVRIWVKLVQGGRCVSHHRQLQHLVKKIQMPPSSRKLIAEERKKFKEIYNWPIYSKENQLPCLSILWPDLVLKPRNVFAKKCFRWNVDWLLLSFEVRVRISDLSWRNQPILSSCGFARVAERERERESVCVCVFLLRRECEWETERVHYSANFS